jgi:uncharacterized protein (TIGR01244 family)
MAYRPLDDRISVAPQLTPEDIPLLKGDGIRMVVCNRPDEEVPSDLGSEAIRAACAASDIAFVDNPLRPGGLTTDCLERQAAAFAEADGPVVCYCASGTRSSVLWAFAMATTGQASPPEILAALEKAGYAMPGLAPQIEAAAARAV